MTQITDMLDLLQQHKISDLRNILTTMEPADIAILVEEIPEEYVPLVFRILPKELAADCFVEMDPDVQESLIHAFSDKELREVLDELFLDDTVDIIEEMPANVVRRILKNTDPQTRQIINEVLKYPKDSAGSIMTIEYVDLRKNMTVEQAFKRIRAYAIDKETIYTCYVTDDARHLIGIVTARTLLLSDPNALIGDIMETNIIYVDTMEDKENVAKIFDKYDFLALPVVDREGRLVGIITVDDAMDVMQEENEEDFAKMAAMSPIEDSYFKTTVLHHAKNRILWLLVLMVSATLTGLIITNYQTAFAAYPLLIAFLPMLMDTGGNCGSQASTMIIRGMAIDDIGLGDFLKAWFKEIRIALIVGAALAAVNTARVMIMYQDLPLALATSLAMFCTVCIAKSLGVIMPMLAKRLKLDPAIMASPLITTIVDCCSVIIYFTVATKILNI
ncbi:MAG: magnesium transporter [Clostridia bacterium]|nr:magnesium transporter [Clostridia bacterium]